MIFYKNTGLNFFCNVFKYDGSVFPLGFSIAFPVAVVSCVLEWLTENDYVDFGQPLPDQDAHKAVMNESAVWGGFTFLVGFLVVFRTSIVGAWGYPFTGSFFPCACDGGLYFL